jgi:hypothetical protein
MKRKIVWEYIIQGNYGNGWEDICPCEDREEADCMLKCYNDNEVYPHRIKKVCKFV